MRERERRSSTPARFPPPGIDPRFLFAEGDEKVTRPPARQRNAPRHANLSQANLSTLRRSF